MVHRCGIETSTEKNKKDDFNSCIAENAKTAGDEISADKIEESAPKAKQQLKKLTKKALPKSTPLPLSDHSISQTVVRLERSRLIRTKNNPNSKADTSSGTTTGTSGTGGVKAKHRSPVRSGLRSSSLESHTSSTSNNNNAKAKKKKANFKKTKAGNSPIESPPQETVKLDTKNAQPKLSPQLPRSFICSLPLNRLSGILEKLKSDKAKCLIGAEEDTSTEDKSNGDQNSSQCKTLCLYCDKRMSTMKVRARHIERFHTISKERRSSSRNPITPSSQDSTKDLLGTSPAASSSTSASSISTSSTNLFFSGCSFCSKSPKLLAVALENDLNALFYHLVDFHSDKYFGCKLCAIRFQNAAKLGDHVQRIHTPTTTKISNPAAVDTSPPLVGEEDRSLSEIDKSTPTKTRRQVKQSVTEILSPPTKPSSASSSSMNRNGSMFSSDEPILSRLGLTQNRLPRGRKGIRSRRQTAVDSVKPETTVINVKTRSKLGKLCTSSEPVETVFRTPTNTRIEPLSCTFDEDFYEKVFNNVKTNLSCHLDGKLGNEIDSNRPQSPPPLMPAIRSTVVKSPHVLDSEVHTATSLAALTAFPTLLTAEQYGCDFGTAKIKRPITRHSWKWKWDSVKKYKYVNEGGKIVKKIKQPMLGLRDLSKLDMWTQLTMRQKHEVVRKRCEATSSQCLVEYSDNSREEKQKQVDQLNTILDSRRLPQIILEQSEQTIIKLEITDEGFRYLAGEMSSLSPLDEEPSTSLASVDLERVIPANLNLIPIRLPGDSFRNSVVLSGEWARPRCYVCFGCGARFDKLKALEEHKMFRHPHVYSTHYEIVGRELMEGNLYKHFFIPLKALSRHKEYAQRILVNKKTEYNVSTTKSSSNSGNEEESLDSLHSATASFTTLSSSKLSDDCDTDTKTAIENVTSFAEPSSEHSAKNDDTSLGLVSSSISSTHCTKCKRNCHGILELYRHMLDCSGDYAWILAKKKKYRYYGSRRRRQFNRQNVSSLHLHRRKVKVSKDENESDETPKKKTSNMSPSTPRPRASDADSIRKMLENLPPKRVCREIIPNATKPRSRKFKTTAGGRKIQQTNANKKCKNSNSTLTAISKKILRNHKLRAISEKDKITRNKKILETKRKSARVNNSGQNTLSDSKSNKKTESGNGRSIVRKIGTTTKRFVKKIKKRLLGEKKTGTSSDVEKTSEEKKPTKLSAVRKLTFNKEHDVSVVDKTLIEDDTPTEVKQSESIIVEENSLAEMQEKLELLTNENKHLVPTITVETDFEPKKQQDSSLNEDSSFRSEGSTENLLSASTEELHRLNPGLMHNQVSPTTKRRSKKINDCIAMLTGKIQEKLGKPFLECKEAKEVQGAEGARNSTESVQSTLPPTPEHKDTKPPKRKAFTRRIVKCDQTTEIASNLDASPPVAECQTAKSQAPKVASRREPSIRKTSPKQSPLKELPSDIPQPKDSQTSVQQSKVTVIEVLPTKATAITDSALEISNFNESFAKEKVQKEPPLELSVELKESLTKKPNQLKATALQMVPTKDSLAKKSVNEHFGEVPHLKEFLIKEPLLKGTQLKDQASKSPIKEQTKDSPIKRTPMKEQPKESTIKGTPIKEQTPEPSIKEIPLIEQQRELPIKGAELKKQLREPPIKGLPLKTSVLEKPIIQAGLPYLIPPHIELLQKEPSLFKDLTVVNKEVHQVTQQKQPTEPLFLNPLLSPTFKPDLVQPPQVMSPVCNNFKSSSSKRAPPPPVTIEITTPPPVLVSPQLIPSKLSHPLPPNQHSAINADTIRVPCIKQPHLTIPQFNPVQVPAPRGMITKRRQTIACAPNDFLYEMNSLRCANNDYNDLPFELEVPLDLSKKGKRSPPKSKPCTKPKAPPVHFPQISVKSNAVLMPPVPYHLPIPPQTQIMPLLCESLQQKVTPQSPTLVSSKESPKPATSTPRKRATSNKKQDTTVVNVSQVSLNLATDTITLPKEIVPPPPTAAPMKTNLIKEPVLVLPLPTAPIVSTGIEPSTKETGPAVPQTQTEDLEKTDDLPKKPNLLEETTAVTPTKALSTTAKVTKNQADPVESTEVEIVKSQVSQDESSSKMDIAKDTKGPSKANKKVTQVAPKKAPPSSNVNTTNHVIKSSESEVKNESKCEPPASESQKQIPTRRSRRNKAIDQSETKKPAISSDPPPPAALKEAEAIAASFLSDDEQETTVAESAKPKQPQEETPPKAPVKLKGKPDEPEKSRNEIDVLKEVEDIPIEKLSTEKEKTPEKVLLEPVINQVKETKATIAAKPESAKKPRKRRKNELAAIVADQLMESFKEVDKSRIDDLKRLENLAYEKSEDLLLTGMRLMPTTKRKNVLDNNSKKEANTELESKTVNPPKDNKKQKSEKPNNIQKDDTEVFKDPKGIPKTDVKIKKQSEESEAKNKILTSVTGKDEIKTKPMSLDFSNYRSNSVESWSNRRFSSALPSPANEKSPNSDIASVVDSKKDKKSKNKKQMKKRDKKIEIENINQLRTGLESFTLSKNAVDNATEDMPTRNTEHPLSIVGLFSGSVQRNTTGVSAINKEPEVFSFGGLTSVKPTSSILRPSILAASLDIATNKETTLQNQNDRKSVVSSRDPRLNKNIHTEEGDPTNMPPETVSRLATLRQRRKSFADATPPSYTSRPNSRATSNKRSNANTRRSSLAFDDDDDDNYLTAIAKRVNDKIMSAEDKDFNLANDGFELANSCIDIDDPYGRPSTSMSVRSAPNFNEDRSNMDTMDATNTDLIDMDVDDDMSVYTTFSQDTTRSKSGRRRRRRRSVLLTRKTKKRNVNPLEPLETFDCHLCNKQFGKAAALNKHQLTIAHVSKVSEQEYLNATRQKQEEKDKPAQKPPTVTAASPAKPTSTTAQPTTATQITERTKQHSNAIHSAKHEEAPILPKVSEMHEKLLIEKIPHKLNQHKLPYIPPNSILNQSGIEPISSPEQNYERYSTKTSSRLTLNPDERLFYECCNILKGSETPLVERTYPIIPPTTYAYDLQVKPVTPKSPNERFSYIKQSTIAEVNGKREGGSTYPRLDVNQFSDISSDSNPACAQPPPILPVNYAQMHVLSGAKDQAVLPNDEGGGSALRSILPRDNPVLQMASLATPNLAPAPPLTARTFVNQPSQIGTHLHGIESAATNQPKQNFISPLHSASSQSSTITTTTCRLKTKAAMKGYDNLKVSIPTIGLDMEHALERSPRPGCKLTTLADIALGHETPLSSFTPTLQMHNDQKSKGKIKIPSDIREQQFPAILNEPKENQVPSKKKSDKPLVKESSLIISVHDTESCTPIVLSPLKKPESIIPKDIYDFDDSDIDTPISKAIQSPFKTAEDNDGTPKKVIIIPERPFKNIGMEEQEGIKFQKPVTPAIHDENSTSTVSYSDRDDFVYGSISGGDDDNEIENENDDNKDVHVDSDESSNSSAFTAKTFENKSLIMGRIFKNAKTKPKTPIEKPILPTPEPPKQIPKQELDRLFDTLRGMNENRLAANAAKEEQRQEISSNSSRRRESLSNKRKTPAAAKPVKAKPNTSKPNKRPLSRKTEHSSKEMAQLHAELGMSPAEIAELIGEGQRKSQRRCAVNRPKKLVEIWSSDEFEEFLSTKDIIALIEEKEQQKTKKKKKTSSSVAKKSNSSTGIPNKGNKTDTDAQSVTQSEDDKPTSKPPTPQKTVAVQNLAASKSESTKKAKVKAAPKGKKKMPTVTANVMAPPKTASKTKKEPKPSTSRSNSSEAAKNNVSPFKKPTQKNIISKIADDSESDFETELNRRSRSGSGAIRNRRKTISGKLENDAGSSSSAKKVSGKSKTTAAAIDSRNQSSTNKTQPADSSSIRPQARRKRIASEMLYYWSSSSDEEFGRIESPHDDEHHIEENENYQQHGWIVGDSHKKLVTLLAIAKGNKKVDDCGVKETSSKKKS